MRTKAKNTGSDTESAKDDQAKSAKGGKTKSAKGKNKKKAKKPLLSPICRPDGMSLVAWQRGLRTQAAEAGNFAVSEKDADNLPGYYRVVNGKNGSQYNVVYRGADNEWNYCSCMDFRTNRLGTCKHCEAVKLWIRKKGRKLHRGPLAYSSVYLSYRDGREVKLRIGSDNAEGLRALASGYFSEDGFLLPGAERDFDAFLRRAREINAGFRCYGDALDYVVELRERARRASIASDELTDEYLDGLMKTTLFPYQKEGVRFAFRAGKSIIADEMGLGKTIQAIATAELLRKQGLISSALIVCPNSLKYQWKREIERFTDATATVVEGNHLQRKVAYNADEFYKIVSYNSLSNDLKILKGLYTDMVILDEVQRLKNWETQISRHLRLVKSTYAVVLSGTPLENKLEDLYSVMQFVDQYCLGPYYKFIDDTVIRSETGKVVGYKNLNEVGKRMRGVLIRRRKADVALQLPARMDKIQYVPMTERQREMHNECQMIVSQIVHKWNRFHFLSETDRRRLLLMLSQMRMLCDSTYILDQTSRSDTKVDEVVNIVDDMVAGGDQKMVIFSQWERMTRLIAAELDKRGIEYEYLHGGVPSKARKKLIDNFSDRPQSRVFLTTDAGATGLNLQVASVLVNIDLPWNPAVLEQRIARIYRIGQQRNIQVINLVASDTIEERMLSTLNFKSSLFEGVLDNGEDSIFLDNSRLDKMMTALTDVVEPQEQPTAQPDSDGGDGRDENEKPVSADDTPLPVDDIDFEDLTPAGTTEADAMAEGAGTSRSETPAHTEASAIDPKELLGQGMSFLSGLASTLASPEATERLVDTLVEEDPSTGKANLRIPVPDKATVRTLFSALASLLK